MSSRRFLSVVPLLMMAVACAGHAVPVRAPTAVSVAFASQDAGNVAPQATAPVGQKSDGKDASSASSVERSRSSIQVFFGGRSFKDETLWSPVEGQFVVGAEFDWIAAGSVLGFEIGAQSSFGTEETGSGALAIDHGGSASELYLGLRFDTALFGSPLHLVAGVGPSLLTARLSREVAGSLRSGSSGSFGIYGHLGLLVDLGDVGLGLDYRGRGGEDLTGFEDVFGSEVTGSADYGQLALTFALQF